LAGLTALAIVGVRARIGFGTPVPGGVDFAYYPLQARSLLEGGGLAYADAPLLFGTDALLAGLRMQLSGIDITEAVVDAAVWRDVAIGALAVPLAFCLAMGVGGEARSVLGGAILGSLILGASPWSLSMVGNFGKQTAGAILCCSCWISAWLAIRRGSDREQWGRWLLTGMLVVAAAAAHVASAALAVAGLLLILGLGGALDPSRIRSVAGQAAAALFAVLVAAGIAIAFAPQKLAAVVVFLRRLVTFRWSDADGLAGYGLAGVPDGPAVPWALAVWLALSCLTAVLSLRMVAMRRRAAECTVPGRMHPADIALFVSMQCLWIVVTCPLLGGDAPRIFLMCIGPIALTLAFPVDRILIACHPRPIPESMRRILPVVPLALSAAVCVSAARVPVPDPMISSEGRAQLQAWSSQGAVGDNAVVAARHGLEYWVSLDLGSEARWGEFRDCDFDEFDRMFVLQEHVLLDPSGVWRRRPVVAGSTSGRRAGLGNGPLSIGRLPPGAKPVLESAMFTLWEVPRSAREWYRSRRQEWMDP
jgi:hypothetical protein